MSHEHIPVDAEFSPSADIAGPIGALTLGPGGSGLDDEFTRKPGFTTPQPLDLAPLQVLTF